VDNIIRLRALTQADLSKTLAWHNQEDIVELYAGHPFPVNQEMEQKWYERILTSNYPTTVFGIEVIKTSLLVGISLLRDIDLLNRNAETAIYIGDLNERGKGYSKNALLKTLEFAFQNLGLHRVFLKVRIDNLTAINLYKKLGFTQEGELRETVYKNGEFKSLLIFSILKEEYLTVIIKK